MVLYVVIIVLGLALAGASCLALILGMLSEAGVLRLDRCDQCSHFVVQPRESEQATCPYCRHVHLAHPLRTLRHPVRELVHH